MPLNMKGSATGQLCPQQERKPKLCFQVGHTVADNDGGLLSDGLFCHSEG